MTDRQDVSLAEVLVEESPDALIALSAIGEILFWNHGAETIFGYSKKEAVGETIYDLIVPKEYQREAKLRLEQAIEEDTVIFETVRRTKDGSLIYVDVSKRALRDKDGNLRFIVANTKDVTGLVKLRQEKDAKFQGLLEAAPDAIVLADENGNILFINTQTEKLFGYSKYELIGHKVEVLIPERLRKNHPEHRAKFFKEPKTRPMGAALDLFGLKKDGTEFPVEISLSSIKTEDGLLLASAIRDITDRKQLEARLREVSRLKSEFLANMSHELRTPLNAIMGFASLMHEGKIGDVSTEQKEYLGDILTSSSHLLQLVNDVLDLAKVESGKIEIRPEPFELSKVIKEVKDILRGLAFEKRIEINVNVDPSLTTVTLDPAKFKQILYNYLSNAIKFTPQNGKVMVRVVPEGEGMLRVEVEDNGIGVKPDDLDRLFVEFQQLDSGATKKHAGTGLGLALTKRLVEAQGGKVAVKCAPEQGAIFSAILPLLTNPIGMVREVAPMPLTSHKHPTVLVIEDDAKEREWLVKTLDRAGYFVEGVATGAEAVERCRKRSYAMITLDLLLPDASGWQVLKEIRATSLNQQIPVIVVTLCSESNAGVGFQVHDFLTKPVQEDVLLSTLRRARVIPPVLAPVLIIDDDTRLLKLTEVRLKELGYRPLCTTSVDEAMQLAEKDLPSAVVIDLLMPGLNGFDFIDRFRRIPGGINVPIVVWTAKELVKSEREKLKVLVQAIVIKKYGGTQALIGELKRCLIASEQGADNQERDDGR